MELTARPSSSTYACLDGCIMMAGFFKKDNRFGDEAELRNIATN